jgi:hypothetical protein
MSRVLAALVFCATASAQIPHGHLIYVHRTASSTVPAMGILDPNYGTPTPIVPQSGALTTHGSRTVAIDPQAPNVLYSVTGLATSVAANLVVLTLTGNRYVRTNLQVNLGVPGLPAMLRWAPGHGLLLLGRGGAVNKMFLRDMATGTVTPQPTSNLLPINASDMAFFNGKAYASSEGDGTATAVGTIVEWDLATNTDRVVGTGYAPITALTVFAGQLLAADSNGDLHFIDLVTGAATLFASPALGRITSLAVDPLLRVFAVAENPGVWTVHNVFSSLPVLYSSALAIDDLAVGPTPVATMLTYGSGCVGSNSQVPVLGFTGPPALGTTFGVTLGNALANSGAFLVFGSSRVQDPQGPLPRDLGALGMPGCTQYVDALGTLFTLTNGLGAASYNFTLPNNPAFAAVRIPVQWVGLDVAANPFGATTSSGGECYVY